MWVLTIIVKLHKYSLWPTFTFDARCSIKPILLLKGSPFLDCMFYWWFPFFHNQLDHSNIQNHFYVQKYSRKYKSRIKKNSTLHLTSNYLRLSQQDTSFSEEIFSCHHYANDIDSLWNIYISCTADKTFFLPILQGFSFTTFQSSKMFDELWWKLRAEEIFLGTVHCIWPIIWAWTQFDTKCTRIIYTLFTIS